MSEGLTRRRGAGAAASGSPRTGSPAPYDSGPSTPKVTRITSGGDSNSARIAFDPRDYNDDSETKTQPRLTLMEEVLLLGLKDKAVSRVHYAKGCDWGF